jgi:predicted DNA-binding mobile mystery protein A
MGVTQQTISQLENREADGNVTLEALDKAARALGGQLVYAIVPERPIGDALEERALNIARERTSSVRHSMRLENQEPDSDVDARAQELAKELLANPKKLW